MEGSIILHKERGINPRRTFCTRCGGDGPDIILLGADENKYKCISCGTVHYGRPKLMRCQKCKCNVIKDGVIGEYEKLPGDMCSSCMKELTKFEKIVAGGGVYIKCSACDLMGVAMPGSSIATLTRKNSGVVSPNPVGFEFEACDQHNNLKENER